MKLLILGCGGHGRACAEVASEKYNEIAFLDDNAPEAIGSLNDLKNFVDNFDAAFVALGNPDLREKYMLALKETGFKIATLISTKAVISNSANIGEGTVIMPGAIIQSNVNIGTGCICSAGAIVDHDAQIGDYCHINCGAIVASQSKVGYKVKIDYGELWKNV